jgi:hypothetical protein
VSRSSGTRRTRLVHRPSNRLLAALLHVGLDEFLGVLLEDLVDLVEDLVHLARQVVTRLRVFDLDRGRVFVDGPILVVALLLDPSLHRESPLLA